MIGRASCSGIFYLWVRVQAGIDHDAVDEVIHHRGDAVDTAELVRIVGAALYGITAKNKKTAKMTKCTTP